MSGARLHDSTSIARTILDGFERHYRVFRAVSAAAKERFEREAWTEATAAHRARIDLYDRRVIETVAAVRRQFPRAASDALWPGVKQAYIALLVDHQQPELAETFFNSVACRLLHRTYYNNAYIFWRPAVSTEHIDALQPTFRRYRRDERGWEALFAAVLRDLHLLNDWEDLERDLLSLAEALSARARANADATGGVELHVLSSLFFRNKAAYVVGRIVGGAGPTPFSIPLLHNERHELYADALLLEREELVTLFSLARVYFMVDMEVPSAFVGFLRSILPERTNADLYIALGLQKQGKTLFLRDLLLHLKHSSDRFVRAPGVRGLVMVVFTLPTFPFVFKVIRDRAEPPKDVDRAKVKAQYHLVKHHDRVGRLADTLEYSDLALPESRFEPELLRELELTAPSAIERDGDRLVIKHLYIERRLSPLDLYVQGADERRLADAMREYGNALSELAGANIFPGDLLLKNFGVNRLGRVVFYDYDEIALLESVNFRDLPAARDDGDELASEPWFGVGPNDVFPEEFPRFLFRSERERAAFTAAHPTLFTATYWRDVQRRLRAGEVPDVFPYPRARRFPRPSRGASASLTPGTAAPSREAGVGASVPLRAADGGAGI